MNASSLSYLLPSVLAPFPVCGEHESHCMYCKKVCEVVTDTTSGALICKECGSHLDVCLDHTAFGQTFAATAAASSLSTTVTKTTACVVAEVQREEVVGRTYIGSTVQKSSTVFSAKRATAIAGFVGGVHYSKTKKQKCAPGMQQGRTDVGGAHNRYFSGNRELGGPKATKATAVEDAVKRGVVCIEQLVHDHGLSVATRTSATSLWSRLCKVKNICETKRQMYRTMAIAAALVHIASVECGETVGMKHLALSCEGVEFNTKKTLKRVLGWLEHKYFSHYQVAEGYIKRYCGPVNLNLAQVYTEAALLILHTYRRTQTTPLPKSTPSFHFDGRVITTTRATTPSSSHSMIPDVEFPECSATYTFDGNSPMLRMQVEQKTPDSTTATLALMESTTRNDPRCLAISCLYTATVLADTPTKLLQTELSKCSGVASNSISKTHNAICAAIEDVVDCVALLSLFHVR